MELSSITIPQIARGASAHAVCHGQDILITDHVGQLRPFAYPCRVCATLVLFCLDGELECSVNLRRYHIGSNQMAVVMAGDCVQIHRTEALEAYAVLLSADYLSDLQIDFRQRTGFYLDARTNAVLRIPHAELTELVPYYPLLKSNMDRPRADTPEVLRALVRAFSYTVISLMNRHRPAGDEAGEACPRQRQLFDKFMALLKVYHCNERSVKFYAGRLCLTPNYLSGEVKAYSGRSAAEWINEYVVLEAKVMLKHTDLSVQEIAYRLNFATQSSFGKYFKAQTGIGPRGYRSSL